MTPQAVLESIRRSPLEGVHAALGARWTSERRRWPADYGSPDGERAAVLEGGGLAELGPYDKLVVASARTASSITAAGLPFEPGRVSTADNVGVWALAGDEAIVITDGDGSALAARIGAGGAVVTDMGSAWTVLRIAGPAVSWVLERACAVDLSHRAIAERAIVQVSLANVRTILARQDSGDAFAITMLVARDEAEYLWGALLRLGRDHGLRPVGARAVAGEVT